MRAVRPDLVLDVAAGPDALRRVPAQLSPLLAVRRTVTCEIRSAGPADLAVVDLMLRLQLAARRCGGRIEFTGVEDALGELIAFAGVGRAWTGSDAARPRPRIRACGVALPWAPATSPWA